MARALIAVVAGIIAAFVSILVIEALGALIAPAGVSPSLKDADAMREYLKTLPLSAYAFVLGAYLFGSGIGGVVAARVARSPTSRCVWTVGGILLVTTIANLVLIPHPLWFSIAAVVAIFAGTVFASLAGPARVR
jgi:hypothetical protein